ncbi:MAG: hypothetical protein EA376_01330 [Phycisphaeraceae bacterium]|nr:MAG: hypothetical protein EA376_01330 [Phycisphaeraceae bacterium]
MVHRHPKSANNHGYRPGRSDLLAALALLGFGLLGGCVVSPHAARHDGRDDGASTGSALVFDAPAVRSARQASGRVVDLANPEYGRRDATLGIRETIEDMSRDEGRTVIDRRRRSLHEPYREVRRGHISPRTLYRRDYR